jgi:hypothetical protein
LSSVMKAMGAPESEAEEMAPTPSQ